MKTKDSVKKYWFSNAPFRQEAYVAFEDYEEIADYCDRLVDFLPCLPKDVDNLRGANGRFAIENERLRNRLYRLGECPDCEQEVVHYKYEPFASCDCGQIEDCSGPSIVQKLKDKVEELEELEEIKEIKVLKDELVRLEKEKQYYISVIREHSEAASIFQCDGKYHKEANLCIGDSTVVEGIKWLDMSLEGYKQKWKEALHRNKVLEHELSMCVIGRNAAAKSWEANENKVAYFKLALADSQMEAKALEQEIGGWKKKWECAVEMAAIAQNKLDNIKNSL